MTHMLRKNQSDHHKISTNNPIHKDSRVISKIQPKIRIIHIFAPEIIQTDVANFRELVQRLTGKPSSSSAATTSTTTTTATTTTTTSNSSGSSSFEKNMNTNTNTNTNANNKVIRKLPVRPQFTEEAIPYNQISKMEGDEGYNYQNYKPIMNVGNKGYFGNYDHDGDHRDNGGFLEVFEGVNDSFMQEINDFSIVPMEANHHHHPFGDNFHQLSYRGSY